MPRPTAKSLGTRIREARKVALPDPAVLGTVVSRFDDAVRQAEAALADFNVALSALDDLVFHLYGVSSVRQRAYIREGVPWGSPERSAVSSSLTPASVS